VAGSSCSGKLVYVKEINRMGSGENYVVKNFAFCFPESSVVLLNKEVARGTRITCLTEICKESLWAVKILEDLEKLARQKLGEILLLEPNQTQPLSFHHQHPPPPPPQIKFYSNIIPGAG
jgi:hypothetical protein